DEIKKLNLENETLKVELQSKGKKDKEIARLKQQLEQYQNQSLQFDYAHVCLFVLFFFAFDILSSLKIKTYLKQKTTLIEMEKLKKKIKSKHNEIQKIKQEIQIMEQQKKLEEKNNHMNYNIEEQKEDNINDNLSTLIINTSSTFNFELVRSLKLIKTFTGHTNWVRSIDYSTLDNNQIICSGSGDNTVRVWDIDNNKQIQSFDGHSSYVNCVKFSSYHYQNYSQNVICSSSNDNTIRFWDFKHNKQLQIFNETRSVCGIEFSQFNGGRYLCSGSYDKTIRLWDVETSNLLHAFNEHENVVWCVDISPLQSNNNKNDNTMNNIGVIGGNGYSICSGSFDKTIRIWDIETTKQFNILKGHTNYVWSIKYGSNQLINTILSGSDDNSVRLWDIRINRQIQVYRGHEDYVNIVEYSPFVIKDNDNSNVICSGSNDNTICFWDIRSNKNALHVIKGNKQDNGILCLKFIGLKKNEKNNENENNLIYDLNLCYSSLKGQICIWG
ncbi:WD-40 repeat protein, partial [Reticulomyxa filosa]